MRHLPKAMFPNRLNVVLFVIAVTFLTFVLGFAVIMAHGYMTNGTQSVTRRR